MHLKLLAVPALLAVAATTGKAAPALDESKLTTVYLVAPGKKGVERRFNEFTSRCTEWEDATPKFVFKGQLRSRRPQKFLFGCYRLSALSGRITDATAIVLGSMRGGFVPGWEKAGL